MTSPLALIRRNVPARIHCLAVAGLLALGSAAAAAASDTWPVVALPAGARAYGIGQQLTVNGLPMRMQGFLSALPPAQLAAWFRTSLGKPLVENTLASKLILGKAQGEHYVTVQLEPVATGTRALISVSHLKAGLDGREDTQAVTRRWLARLPAGSRLDSRMTSSDAGRASSYLVISNTHHEDLNRDRLVELMRDDGLALEREAQVDSAGALPGGAVKGRTLFFKGPGKEAMAVICLGRDGRSIVVLNTITAMERQL